jgi:ankyrin repeat protein
MRKSLVIIAVAFGFMATTLNATSTVSPSTNLKIVKKSVVSPFCLSIVKGDLDTVKKLIELGADVNEKSNGMTPVMYAAKYNKVEILKLLVDYGADLNKKSEVGLTVEKYAQLSNAKEALEFLHGIES